MRIYIGCHFSVFVIVLSALSHIGCGHPFATGADGSDLISSPEKSEAIDGSRNRASVTKPRAKRGLFNPSYLRPGQRVGGYDAVDLERLMRKLRKSSSQESDSHVSEYDESISRNAEETSEDGSRKDSSSHRNEESSEESIFPIRRRFPYQRPSPRLNLNLLRSTPEGREIYSKLSRLFRVHRRTFANPESKRLMAVLAKALVPNKKHSRRMDAMALTGMAEILYSKLMERTLKGGQRFRARSLNSFIPETPSYSADDIASTFASSSEDSDSKGIRYALRQVTTPGPSVMLQRSHYQPFHPTVIESKVAVTQNPLTIESLFSSFFSQRTFNQDPGTSTQALTPSTPLYIPSTTMMYEDLQHGPTRQVLKVNCTTSKPISTQVKYEGFTNPITTTYSPPLTKHQYQKHTEPESTIQITNQPHAHNYGYVVTTRLAPIKYRKDFYTPDSSHRKTTVNPYRNDLMNNIRQSQCCKYQRIQITTPMPLSPPEHGKTRSQISRFTTGKPEETNALKKNKVVHNFPVYVEPDLMQHLERAEGPVSLSGQIEVDEEKITKEHNDNLSFNERLEILRRMISRRGGSRLIQTTKVPFPEQDSVKVSELDRDIWDVEPIRHITQTPLKNPEKEISSDNTNIQHVSDVNTVPKRKFVITTSAPYPRLLPPLKPEKLTSIRSDGKAAIVSKGNVRVQGATNKSNSLKPVIMRLLPAWKTGGEPKKVPRLLPADDAIRRAVPKLLPAIRNASRMRKNINQLPRITEVNAKHGNDPNSFETNRSSEDELLKDFIVHESSPHPLAAPPLDVINNDEIIDVESTENEFQVWLGRD